MKQPEVEARRWLTQARDDLAFAEWLLSEDRCSIPTRYPNGLPAGSPCESFRREDLESACGMAHEVVEAAAAILGY